MPDEPKDPRPYDRYSVEDQGKAKAAHDQARDNSPPAEKVEGRGSDQVRNTDMHPEPRPEGDMREGPERDTHLANLAKEQARARRLNSFAATRAQKVSENERTAPRSYDRYAEEEQGKTRTSFGIARDNKEPSPVIRGGAAQIDVARVKNRAARLQAFAATKAGKEQQKSVELTHGKDAKDRTD